MTSRDDAGADLVVAAAMARGCEIYRFNSEDYPAAIGLDADVVSNRSAALLDPSGPITRG